MALNLEQRVKSFIKWFKLFIPLSRLRFYPPQFVIRNPVLRAVAEVFSQGHEVAVIVFNFNDAMKLNDQISKRQYETYITHAKIAFKEVIIDIIPKEDIVIVHDYQLDGVTLLMRMDSKVKRLSGIDDTMNEIVSKVQARLLGQYAQLMPSFLTGYMFVDKQNDWIEDSVRKAHHQAMAMAIIDDKMNSKDTVLFNTIDSIILEKNIRLMAQPIFEVETNRIKAYEVLTRGPIGTELESPLALFSVARQMGKLFELEMIVLEKTFQQISENGSLQTVFINFTPVTLGHSQFLIELKSMLDKFNGVNAENIVLEVTEQDPIQLLDCFKKNIHSLRELGFRVAVDDTGIGYSTLSSIIEIMPDIIKIDRSLIQDIDSNSLKESMLKGLLLIAKESGSVVIAEGIESEGEAMVLSRNKVELAQGFFYAKPASVEKISISSEK